MTVREIPTAGSLPPLKLPPAALSPSDHQYQYDLETDPPAIEPVEHQLRVDLLTAGPPRNSQLLNDYSHFQADGNDQDPWQREDREKPLALKYAKQTIEAQWETEQEYLSPDAPTGTPRSAYLQKQIETCNNSASPGVAFRKERNNRRQWYQLMSWKSLFPVFKQNSVGPYLRRSGNVPRYVGVIVIPTGASKETAASEYTVSPDYIRTEKEVTHHDDLTLPGPTDYGIELPAPLLLGQYPSGTTSEYLLLPWTGGLVCQGPFKTDSPYRVCCKHEAAAAFRLTETDDIFLPIDEGVDVPATARRFIAPQIAISHTPTETDAEAVTQ